jgi:hypothetical protein
MKSNINTVLLVSYYVDAHLTLRQISKLTGLSPAGISKRLRISGISATSGEMVQTFCTFCNRNLTVPRSIYLRSNRHYCNTHCKSADMVRVKNGNRPWERESRLARAIVHHYYPLRGEMVVHFKDGDNTNTDRCNLMVFKNEKERVKYTQGKKSNPLWEFVIPPRPTSP